MFFYQIKMSNGPVFEILDMSKTFKTASGYRALVRSQLDIELAKSQLRHKLVRNVNFYLILE